MFSKHKTVIGFSFGRKGQVQATSEVKCQLMSFKATIFKPYDLISKPNVTYGTAVTMWSSGLVGFDVLYLIKMIAPFGTG